MSLLREGKTNWAYILLVLILAVIVGGWALWLSMEQEVPSTKETKDEISALLESLKQETGINFSEIQPLEFKWVVKVDPEIQEVDIEGKGFEVRGISTEQETKIEEFFTKRGFEKDLYNIADGTVSGLVGYKKGQTVCVVISGASGYKEATGQWIPPDWNKRDVDVKCGKLEEVEELTEKEQACINSGGQISTSLCCKSTGDFPNLCLIGPCGCSPENSHQVKVCDCGPERCFNGNECVVLENK